MSFEVQVVKGEKDAKLISCLVCCQLIKYKDIVITCYFGVNLSEALE